MLEQLIFSHLVSKAVIKRFQFPGESEDNPQKREVFCDGHRQLFEDAEEEDNNEEDTDEEDSNQQDNNEEDNNEDEEDENQDKGDQDQDETREEDIAAAVQKLKM